MSAFDARSDEIAPAKERRSGVVIEKHEVWQSKSCGSGCGHLRSPFAGTTSTSRWLLRTWRERVAAERHARRGGGRGQSSVQATRRALAPSSPRVPAGERAARSLGGGRAGDGGGSRQEPPRRCRRGGDDE